MRSEALINGRVFDGEQVHSGLTVVIEGGRIAELMTGNPGTDAFEKTWDLDGHLLTPGLIDLQVNGGGGLMFNQAPTVETIRVLASAHRRFGTTGLLPTLISDSRAQTRRAIAAVREAMATGVPGLLGIHIEGPFLNPAYRGVHEAANIRPFEAADFELLSSAGHGVTLLTVAPEIIGAEAIGRLTAAGVIVVAGHSAATYEQVQEALRAGLAGFTHLFNAMTPFTSRQPGMVGAALEDADSWAGIIADGAHVHPASFAVAVAAKRRGGMILVSDAMATVGWDGDGFDWNGQEVRVRDGSCRLPDGRLAGSHLDMIAAVRNAARFARIDRLEALRMASAYPARALGLEHELGHIRPGWRASMIELDRDFEVRRSWIDGQAVEYPQGSD